MAAPPPTVTLTCPVCGGTEEATGSGSLSSSFRQGALETEAYTTLNWGATAQHICPGITPPSP